MDAGAVTNYTPPCLHRVPLALTPVFSLRLDMVPTFRYPYSVRAIPRFCTRDLPHGEGVSRLKYDKIIVGGGSAGCVLAARLSEDSSRAVLLLEAGPDYPDFDLLPDELKHPLNDVAAEINAGHNWSFTGRATPQQSEPMHVPRGRVVGGSSAINGQVFLRGIPEDYDNWASWGNDEWSFVKVLPYFRNMESDLDIRDDFHGADGPIPVLGHKRQEWPPFQEAFYTACVAAGFPEDPDMNNPETSGVAPHPMNNPNGIRMSTALTHLNDTRHRLNLTIRPGVLARRILFDGPRAIGVEVESGGQSFAIQAEEVLLCAGAIQSPQTLMLSGVGPGEQLRGLGIPVVHDLPGVGRNLRDHPAVTLQMGVKDGLRLGPNVQRMQVGLRYTAAGSKDRNDIQVLAHSYYHALSEDNGARHGILIRCVLERPLGSGELKLTSTDLDAQPHLEYRYLEHPWDRERLREAVRMVVRLLEHESYKDMVEGRITPTDQDLASEDALDAWMLRHVATSQHSSGTCKMGPSQDPQAVVDQYGRVHGLDGIRVVDASIMPDVIRANTNATTIMIAERIADWLR